MPPRKIDCRKWISCVAPHAANWLKSLPRRTKQRRVGQDKLHRTYGFIQAADAEFANASPRSRTMLEAYARGVNAYASSLDPKSSRRSFKF